MNPVAEHADLLLGQSGILIALVRGGHFHVLDQLGDVGDHWALGAVAGDDGRVAALATFNYRREAVHAVFAFRFLPAVAFDAGLLKQRLDVLLVGLALLVRGGRQFAGIPLHLFLVLFGAHESERAQAERGRNEGPNVSAEAVGQAARFHGSIVHGDISTKDGSAVKKIHLISTDPCPLEILSTSWGPRFGEWGKALMVR